MRKIILFIASLFFTTLSAQNWTGTWATAIEFEGDNDMPKNTSLSGCAVRQTVHVSLGGSVLRLQLSNAFSKEPVEITSIYIADAKEGVDINSQSAQYLSFNGKRGITIAPGKTAVSDELKYRLQPLQRLSITINYGKTPKNATGHRGSRTTSYIMKGESKPKTTFEVTEKVEHWYNIDAIDVQTTGQAPCIAVLGNSITDGRGSTTDQQNRWTDICAEALQGQIGILNLGIGGNCVLQGGLGQPAVDRFDRDILGQRGLSTVIIYEGINDIGGSKNAERTSRQLISAYKDFIEKARKQGLKVIGGTITPIGHTSYWSYFHEAVRQSVNEWIRTSGNFDAVIDFDMVLRDPAQPTQMNPDYQYDWLHPNAKGYKAMGEEAARIILSTK